MPAETQTLPRPQDIERAAVAAYNEVAEMKRLDARNVHALAACYDVTDAMLRQLGAVGYTSPEHEVRTAPGVPEHSYLAIASRESGEDIIADPTWQQFLPGHARYTNRFPRVLMGGRRQVASQAIGFGVSSELAGLWIGKPKMTMTEQKARDLANAQAADRQAAGGRWESFIQNFEQPKQNHFAGRFSIKKRTGRHRAL